MKRSKVDKRKYKMYNFSRKGAPGSIMELRSVLKETKGLKKSPTLNGIKEVITPGQDSIQLSF